MNEINQLLNSFTCISHDASNQISGISIDSRTCKPTDLFVCIKGTSFDAHSCIPSLIRSGVTHFLVQEWNQDTTEGCTVYQTEDTRKALAEVSAKFYDDPAKSLITIGVTGTKGKTSTTYMIRESLESLGIPTGLIGTIETIIGEKHEEAVNTTPESLVIQKTLREMVDAGLKAVVMEVSSQGLKMHRTDEIFFDYAIFTNLSPDHIGEHEHPDFQDYLRCKSKLFRQCKIGIVNQDDPHTEEILQGHTCQVVTFGSKESCDFQGSHPMLFRKGSEMGIQYDLEGKLSGQITLSIPGYFNMYNSLGSIALLAFFTSDLKQIQSVMKQIRVKGRTEIVPMEGKEFTVMIDYAHNAMALESLLKSMRDYHPKRMITIFGCGGNRDKQRRYEMAQVSSKFSTYTIVTTDNPRFEDPETIIQDIVKGMSGSYVAITDRKEAIRYALKFAQDRDLIILAGKGHETYQEIQGKKYHMDDRELIAEIKKENH